MDNFDAIGGWREKYDGTIPIDSTGTLPDRGTFHTFPEFRKLLLDREALCWRCLTEKLMTYALGRELEIGDRPSVDRILAEITRTEGGLHDLIRLVVLSRPFLTN